MKAWWGSFEIPFSSATEFQIGPLNLVIERHPGEWRLAQTRVEEPLSIASAQRSVPVREVSEEMSRYAWRGESQKIDLTPRLSDRAVVSRPEQPFVIPALERVTLFVTLPLWVEATAGQPGRSLTVLPIYRPSDTWFGPTTKEGELCYASRTFCRMRREDVVARPHRALTAVHINNRAEDVLSLERIKIPAQHLALFQTEEGRLATQDVNLEWTGDADFAELKLKDWASKAEKNATLVAPPRLEPGTNLVTRAFSRIFKSA